MPDLSTSNLGAGTASRVITPADRDRVDRETDARFILQTGIAHKLNPQSAVDRKWIPTWQKLHRDVEAAFADGSLVFTYDHPGVANKIADAVTFTAGAIAGLGALAAGQIGPAAAQGAKTADGAWGAAKAAATAGATLQAVLDVANAPRNPDAPSSAPPRVDPALVASAAADVRAATLAGAQGGPRVVVTPQDAHAAMVSVAAPAQAQVAPQAAAAAAAGGGGALVATAPAGPSAGAGAGLGAASGGFPWKIAAGVTAGVIGLVALSQLGLRPRSSGPRRPSSRTLVIRGGR